jgi:hypothetical protein
MTFEKRDWKAILGLKRQHVREGWRSLQNEEFHNFYC